MGFLVFPGSLLRFVYTNMVSGSRGRDNSGWLALAFWSVILSTQRLVFNLLSYFLEFELVQYNIWGKGVEFLC